MELYFACHRIKNYFIYSTIHSAFLYTTTYYQLYFTSKFIHKPVQKFSFNSSLSHWIRLSIVVSRLVYSYEG